jgi:PAS domain-containing protein
VTCGLEWRDEELPIGTIEKAYLSQPGPRSGQNSELCRDGRSTGLPARRSRCDVLFDTQRILEAGLEEVLRQMPAAVIIVETPSGMIVFVNRRAREMAERNLTCSVPLELGHLGDLQDVDENGISKLRRPDGRPYELEEWPLMRSIRSGEEVRDEEYVHILADGSWLWLRCDSSPIHDDEGRIVAGVALFYDMSKQKRAGSYGVLAVPLALCLEARGRDLLLGN